MSIAGIAASSFFSGAIAQASQGKFQKVRQEFQQLGQDLQSGNLQAQSDLAGLTKDLPVFQPSGTSGAQVPGTTFSQSLQKLAQDLQAGNLAAAQSDSTNLRQAVQSGRGSGVHSHHHARHGHESSASANSISQVLSQLGQTLQSGNLSAAQQSYTTLLQGFQQSGAGIALDGGIAPGSGPVTSPLSEVCYRLKFCPIGPISISRGALWPLMRYRQFIPAQLPRVLKRSRTRLAIRIRNASPRRCRRTRSRLVRRPRPNSLPPLATSIRTAVARKHPAMVLRTMCG